MAIVIRAWGGMLAGAALAGALVVQAHAQTRQYGPGVTDTEIKLGQAMPFSGPASAYSQLSRAEQAYFRSINDKGGINGRKIVLVALDDGYSPPKSLEATRRLVESEEVAAIFGTLGTANNLASRAYLNKAKVPQLFVAGGAQALNDPAHYPWTMGWQPSLLREGAFYGREVARRTPGAKVAVLYQNDDFGKELLAGLREGLGADADRFIVSAQSFQGTDPTIDSQIVLLKSSGADTLFLFTYAKQAAQAIRKTYELGWRPTTYLTLGSAYIGSTFKPAGLEASKGILTGGFIKEPTDPRWADDPDVQAWFQWLKEYMPGADPADTLNIVGYAYARTMEQVLRQCGDDLSRENIVRQAANLRNVRIPVLIPGSVIDTSPTDYNVVEYIKLQRFNGASWDEVE